MQNFSFLIVSKKFLLNVFREIWTSVGGGGLLLNLFQKLDTGPKTIMFSTTLRINKNA